MKDGKPGLLASGDFGKAVESELSVLSVEDIHDSKTLTGKETRQVYYFFER